MRRPATCNASTVHEFAVVVERLGHANTAFTIRTYQTSYQECRPMLPARTNG